MASQEIDTKLRNRAWLLGNIEWFISEVQYHREMKKYFGNKKISVWKYGEKESSTKITNETSFQ